MTDAGLSDMTAAELSNLLTADQVDECNKLENEVLLLRAEVRELRSMTRANQRSCDKMANDIDELKLDNRALRLQSQERASYCDDLLGKLIAVGQRTKHLENIVNSLPDRRYAPGRTYSRDRSRNHHHPYQKY